MFLELQLQSQDFLSHQFHDVPLVPDYLIFLKHRRCNASNARHYSASSSSLFNSTSHLQKKVNSKSEKSEKSGRVTTCVDSDPLSTATFLHFSVSVHLCDSTYAWQHRLELFPVLVTQSNNYLFHSFSLLSQPQPLYSETVFVSKRRRLESELFRGGGQRLLLVCVPVFDALIFRDLLFVDQNESQFLSADYDWTLWDNVSLAVDRKALQ